MKPKPFKADLDDILFEDRERRYGAYELRKAYSSRLMLSAGSVLLFFMLSAFTPNIMGLFGETEITIKKERVHDIVLEDIPDLEIPEDEPEIVIPPEPPKPPIFDQIADLIPEPVNEDDLEEEVDVPERDSLLAAPRIGLVNIEGNADADDIDFGDMDGEGPAVIETVKETYPNEGDFVTVSEEPKPTNMEDVRKLIGYPEIALDAGIEGQVVIRVLVDKFGNYVKHKVIKKEHPILSRACEKQLSKLKFTPAVQGGKPIAFWVNIPFKFKTL